MMSQAGSFAHFTLTQRMPTIAQQVIEENDFPSSIQEKLERLIQELPEGIVRSLEDDSAPDLAQWQRYLEPFLGKRWLDIPWFFAEAYFYRRIVEATQYFQPGAYQGVDPFALQKRRGLETAKESIRELSTRVNAWIEQEQNEGSESEKNSLIALLYSVLWGNRADLSLWPIDTEQLNFSQEIHLEQSQILVDDTSIIADRVANLQGMRFDIIVDNAGFELFCDLCVADFLLATETAKTLYLHLKPHPTFVSDATIEDVYRTLKVMASETDRNVQLLAHRLQEYIAKDRLQCRDDYFWTSPLVFWEMPEPLRQDLAESALILVKGDANYRRCLGDRHWPFTTAFEDIVSYFPAAFVALRTLKSEVAAGLGADQIERLNREDSNWLTNGQWGVIQLGACQVCTDSPSAPHCVPLR
jgi:uncharacterized protein with ATP-grasp and redox domains